MGGPPLGFINIQPQIGGPPLKFINLQPPKRGSASRIHLHTAPQRGPLLKFINQRGSASRFHQHQPKNGGPPLGTISMDLQTWGQLKKYDLKDCCKKESEDQKDIRRGFASSFPCHSHSALCNRCWTERKGDQENLIQSRSMTIEHFPQTSVQKYFWAR
jgi:hypothetical protein